MNDKLRKGGRSVKSVGVSFSCETISPVSVFESGNLLPMSGRAQFLVWVRQFGRVGRVAGQDGQP